MIAVDIVVWHDHIEIKATYTQGAVSMSAFASVHGTCAKDVKKEVAVLTARLNHLAAGIKE